MSYSACKSKCIFCVTCFELQLIMLYWSRQFVLIKRGGSKAYKNFYFFFLLFPFSLLILIYIYIKNWHSCFLLTLNVNLVSFIIINHALNDIIFFPMCLSRSTPSCYKDNFCLYRSLFIFSL